MPRTVVENDKECVEPALTDFLGQHSALCLDLNPEVTKDGDWLIQPNEVVLAIKVVCGTGNLISHDNWLLLRVVMLVGLFMWVGRGVGEFLG